MTSTNEIGTVDGMADSIPLSPVVIPTSIRLQLCKVVARGEKSFFYDGYKVANEALSNWLTLHLDLCTDYNWWQLLGGAFVVNFDWAIQKWVVRA